MEGEQIAVDFDEEELNTKEMKLIDRVKMLKRQKYLSDGGALLAQQDFIGFSKTSLDAKGQAQTGELTSQLKQD